MSLGPFKRSGFKQGIHGISSSKREELGTLRMLQDGRKFRYAKAGGADLAAGKMGIGPSVNSNHANQTGIAAAVATMQLTLTVTAGTAIAENQLAGGFLQINDSDGEGYQYSIQSNSAIDSSGTSIILGLNEGLRVAMTTSSEFTLIASPWYGATESATEENQPVGIAPVAVTTLYYYWAQTGGVAIAFMDSTPAKGAMLTLGTVAGSLKAMTSATWDNDQPILGHKIGLAGVNDEFGPVMLTID